MTTLRRAIAAGALIGAVTACSSSSQPTTSPTRRVLESLPAIRAGHPGRPVRIPAHGGTLRLPTRPTPKVLDPPKCTYLPFPGTLLTEQSVSDCREIVYRHYPNGDFSILVGAAPKSGTMLPRPSGEKVLIYNQVNGPISFVRLPRSHTQPYIAGVRVPVVVVGFKHSGIRDRFDLRAGRFVS